MVMEKMKELKLNAKPIRESAEDNKKVVVDDDDDSDEELIATESDGLQFINGGSKSSREQLAAEAAELWKRKEFRDMFIMSGKPPKRPKFKTRHKPSSTSSEVYEEPRSVEFSKAALKYFNERNGTDYVLDDVVHMAGDFFMPNNWEHINFLAKPQNFDNASSKLFFAEIQVANPLNITTCCIVGDPNGAGDSTLPETVAGCGFCLAEKNLRHPVGGFSKGNWPYGTHSRVVEDDDELM